MKQMSIRLPEETYTKLEAQAEAVGVAPAVLARVYLKDLVEKRHHGSQTIQDIAAGLNPDMTVGELQRWFTESFSGEELDDKG